jgi:hypothetical protein
LKWVLKLSTTGTMKRGPGLKYKFCLLLKLYNTSLIVSSSKNNENLKPAITLGFAFSTSFKL